MEQICPLCGGFHHTLCQYIHAKLDDPARRAVRKVTRPCVSDHSECLPRPSHTLQDHTINCEQTLTLIRN